MDGIAGIFYVKINGRLVSVASSGWTFNLGVPKAETVLDSTGKPVGLKTIPQVSFIEGSVINVKSLDLKALLSLRNATGTLELENGKTYLAKDANQVGEGTGSAEDGTVPIRLEAASVEEVV
jgi:hypothetical protein